MYVVDKLQLTPDTNTDPPPQPSVLKRILKEIKARILPAPKMPQSSTLKPRGAYRPLIWSGSAWMPTEYRARFDSAVLHVAESREGSDRRQCLCRRLSRRSARRHIRCRQTRQRLARRPHGRAEAARVLTTDLAVQRFKASNNLISSGGKLGQRAAARRGEYAARDRARRNCARRGPLRPHQDHSRWPHDRCGRDGGYR